MHVVFMNLAATGHVNPTLPVVAALKSRGCTVTYFAGESLKLVVEAAGASWSPFRYPDSDMTGTLSTLDERAVAKYVPAGTDQQEYESYPNCLVYNAEIVLPGLLEDLQALEPRPSVIVYEPFLAFALVAAHVMRLPAVSILTMPGPGVLPKSREMIQALESKPWVDGPRRLISAEYGFDVVQHGLQMEFYSPMLNIVSTVDELYRPACAGEQAKRYGLFPFQCVGVLADSKIKRLENANVKQNDDSAADGLLADMDASIAAGRRIVYVSMGTVATSKFWDKPFGHLGTPTGLADVTGKEMVQHVVRCCFNAFAGDDDIVVVLVTGGKDDALRGLSTTPLNFIIRKSVPQLEVLKRASAFVTHGGANSMHESLSLKVPMCVIPIFGDQPLNAESIVSCGSGLAFRKPMEEVTVGTLRKAVDELLKPGHCNPFRAAASEIATKLCTAGGSAAAAKAIMELSLPVVSAKGGA
jgi:UDP:flavonoid glycosyltransferase YjiC (YdhE family)